MREESKRCQALIQPAVTVRGLATLRLVVRNVGGKHGKVLGVERDQCCPTSFGAGGNESVRESYAVALTESSHLRQFLKPVHFGPQSAKIGQVCAVLPNPPSLAK